MTNSHLESSGASKMVLDAFDNLKQFLEGSRHFVEASAYF